MSSKASREVVGPQVGWSVRLIEEGVGGWSLRSLRDRKVGLGGKKKLKREGLL